MNVLRQDRQAVRWLASMGVVLLVHVLVAAAILWWHVPRVQEPLPQQAVAVMVELAPLTRAPSTPPTELPPGPPRQEQEQRKRQPSVATVQPSPAVPRQVLQDADAALARQVSEPQQQDSASSTEASAPPSVPAPDSNRHAASQALAGTVSQALANWQVQVLGHLEQFKRFPRAAQRRRYEGVVQVLYAVDRRGNVLSVSLARSSGHEPLDTEALAAVRRASPLPPPPADVPGDPVDVTTPVEFFLR